MPAPNQTHSTTPHVPTMAFDIELGPIAQAVSRELCGQVPPDRVEQLLRELLEREFSDARVTTFLPILLHRFACDTLRAEARGGRRIAAP